MYPKIEIKKLHPGPDCLKCGDTGWEYIPERDAVRRCECQNVKLAELARQSAVKALGQRHAQAALDFEPRSPAQRAVWDGILVDPNRSRWIHGPYQTGKTQILAAAMVYHAGISRELGKPVRVFWRTANQLMRELQQHAMSADADGHRESVILEYLSREDPVHLYIDDIDKIGFDRTQFRSESFFDLVDSIFASGVHGLSVTSQMKPMEAAEKELIPQGTAARIDAMCDVMEVVE